MTLTINAKELRARLGDVVARVKRGTRYTVLYRSAPAFDIVPVGQLPIQHGEIENDSLFKAEPVGASKGGDAALKHDEILYR